MPLPSDIKAVKLLKSAQSALPLTDDPWAGLAHGLFLSRDEFSTMYESLQRDGLIRGLYGEPNVQGAGLEERTELLDSLPRENLRWSGRTREGRWLCSTFREAAAPSSETHWFRIGMPLRFDQAEENLLEPAVDRSYQAFDQQVASLADDPERRTLARRLFSPIPLDPRRDFWSQVAAALGTAASAAREKVRELLMFRHWRRFALRIDPTAAGWQGCGLAMWSLAEFSQATLAAQALAALGGTGDVVVREQAAGYSVSALLLGRRGGAGHEAADAIAAKWNLQYESWTDLELH